MKHGNSNIDDIRALLGHYAVYSVNFLPTFRDNQLSSSTVKNPWPLTSGPIDLSRNVDKEWPLLAA